MINFKNIVGKIAISLAALPLFTQCASSQNVDEVVSITIENAYFQKWAAGREEAGSGFTIYLPIKKNEDIVVNYVYFKGKKVKLKPNNEAIYVGRYTYPAKRKSLVMSADSKEEFGNSAPIVEEKIPFKLTGNECIVVFTKGNKEDYFKIDNLAEKPMIAMPMRNKQ
ncbi:hypothetical protein [Aquimarina mytili]|uniref:Lipoprotein n=1 Tax=Aquimarina mytili TaxID=874423 RepID=A0A937D921_9FLAO|nr:hypothetical protein [Aquimarina mytili]MBL0684640.1 hypothetical protein [Aquimarina mytili]